MSESRAIQRCVDAGAGPATVASLTTDLQALGIRPGELLMVHSSLSALGYVIGGAKAVVLALLEALGPDGTLAMPAFSGDMGDPAPWENPPVPEAWWPLFREHMPAYDPATTPLRVMGAVAERFAAWPGTRRSDHPSCSVCALGPLAESITAKHELTSGFGEHSPLARLYEHDARVLLLGVTHARNSSLHLAEVRAEGIGLEPKPDGAPLIVEGRRRWVAYDDLSSEGEDFEALGEAFARDVGETTGPVALGTARLFPQRAVVDYGVTWLEAHRGA